MPKPMKVLKVRKAVSVSLKARKVRKRRTPNFVRQETYRMPILSKSWRKPKGRKSKLRRRVRPRGSRPGTGYMSPRAVRGLNRLGYREIRVFTPSDLDRIKPSEEMALIAGTVGARKRAEIIRLAGEKKIHVVNA
jgi:large subunit ribosomal protein L32e